MRKLKIRVKKKKLTKIIIPTKLKRIEKVGKWCNYYKNRIPFPIECQWNSVPPLCHNRPKCVKCDRRVTWQKWKDGHWDKIKYAISQGENLTDMESPEKETYEE